jgi:hypothetical protein
MGRTASLRSLKCSAVGGDQAASNRYASIDSAAPSMPV